MRTIQIHKVDHDDLTVTHGLPDVLGHIRSLMEGKYYVTVQKNRPKRSLPQNAYYWAVIVKMMSDHNGDTPDEMHENLLNKFSYEMKADLDGRLVKVLIRTTDKRFNTKYAEDYYRDVRQWALDNWHLEIPEPKSKNDT